MTAIAITMMILPSSQCGAAWRLPCSTSSVTPTMRARCTSRTHRSSDHWGGGVDSVLGVVAGGGSGALAGGPRPVLRSAGIFGPGWC